MNIKECNGLHLPCLVIHHETNLVVRIERAVGNDGEGDVVNVGSSEHWLGKRLNTWNMQAFSQMDNNDLYEDQ